MFDTTGRYLLSSDLGSDRLNVFTLTEGKLMAWSRRATQPGNGPRHLALHPSGHLLYVMNQLENSIACHGYDQAKGKILEQLECVSMLPKNRHDHNNVGSLAIHPSGQFLYASGCGKGSDHLQAAGIAAWHIDTVSGALKPIQYMCEKLYLPGAITMASDGASLFVLDQKLDQKEDSVVRLSIDPVSGRLSQPMRVAKVPTPMSMVVKYI
jgi:6-phosphogluconolactonase (cycloisomerase 2 family)